MNLKAEDILEILQLADFRLSKHELSAFFRKPDNKHYRECKDQVLKSFLLGLERQLHQRGEQSES
ncbi:Glutamate synthase (NADPH) large chain [Vibrio cholerae]|nr:Glutamate synthase (NADPH) large chain [Vibrio cholerae]AYC06930.1 Glutamate synthase (NADPH) large chain [Vibrio cholerae]